MSEQARLADLETSYRAAIARTRRAARRVRVEMVGLLVLLVLIPVGGGAWLALDARTRLQENAMVHSAMRVIQPSSEGNARFAAERRDLLGLQVTGLWYAMIDAILFTVVLVVYRRSSRWLERAARDGRLAPPDDRCAPLFDILRDLAPRMGITCPIRVWRDARSVGGAPQVIEHAGKAHVLVPIKFVALARRDRRHATALLAHELGHVVQQDSRLWIPSSTFSSAIATVARPATIFLVGLSFANGSIGLFVILQLLALLQMWRIERAIIGARRQAEKLADLAAVVYADGTALLEAVAAMPELPPDFQSLHPSRRERHAAIVAILRRLGVDAPPLAPEAPPAAAAHRQLLRRNTFAAVATSVGAALVAIAVLGWAMYARFVYSYVSWRR